MAHKMSDETYEDPIMSPIMKFALCECRMNAGVFTDIYGREIMNPVYCSLPLRHTGPHANVEYAKIEYDEKP